MDYLNQVADIHPDKCCETLSPLARLKGRRNELASKLQDVEAAIAAMEANPEVTKVLELLAKAHR